MPKVLFLETRVVRDANRGTPAETRFDAGKVYDLSVPSVVRWVSRGVATDDRDRIADAERAARPPRPAADAEPDADKARPARLPARSFAPPEE